MQIERDSNATRLQACNFGIYTVREETKMKNQLYCCILSALVLILGACGSDTTGESQTSRSDDKAEPVKPQIERQAEFRKTALQNPQWTKTDRLPSEWAGLYAKDCYMAGPEDNRFFKIQDSQNNTQYYFSYIVFPPATGHKDKADVVVVTYDVWQNATWKDHYLLFGQESFSQILIENGHSIGQHQMLDKRPWDSLAHISTKYRVTDNSRWSVDVNNPEDYGSRKACDLKLAEPWLDIGFKNKKNGKIYKLTDVLQQAGLKP